MSSSVILRSVCLLSVVCACAQAQFAQFPQFGVAGTNQFGLSPFGQPILTQGFAQPAQPAQPVRTRVRKVNCAICQPKCKDFNPAQCRQCDNCNICRGLAKCDQFCVGSTDAEKSANCKKSCNTGVTRCATCDAQCGKGK